MSGHDDHTTVFQVVSSVNEFFMGKGETVEDAAREEAEAVARDERDKLVCPCDLEEAEREETEHSAKRPRRDMTDDLWSLLTQWGLESEHSWLIDHEVFGLGDLLCI